MSARLLPLLPLVVGCHPLGSFTPPDEADDPDAERIAVTPAEVSFGTVSVLGGRPAAGRFSIHNLGAVEVTVSGQDEVLGSDRFVTDAPPLHTLAPGESLEVAVEFLPDTEGAWEADILVQPGLEAVRLVGAATAPVAVVGDESFEPVVLGCTGTGAVALTNAGSEALLLAGATLSSDEYAVVDLPPSLEPGASAAITLAFTPAGGGQRGATLLLETNDPLHPALAIPLSVLGYEGERERETFRYAPSNPTDILFAVETSDALLPMLATASAALAAFVDEVRSTNVDYHLVSVGSGAACPPDGGGYTTRTDTTLQSGAVLERGFAGPAGAWDADLLGLAAAALAETGPGECLDGFRREEADLHVVVVTDGPSAADVDDRLAALVAGLDAEANLRVSALLPISTACGAVAVDYEAAVRTTSGTLADLCAADWVPAFEAFATLPPGADPVRYPLAAVPVESTLAVTVEGAPFTLWTYDPVENAVVFDGDAVPALGAEVAVEYVLAVACGG